MKLKGCRYQELDHLFKFCLEGHEPVAVFRATVMPQPPAKWFVLGGLLACIPPFIFITILLIMLFLFTTPLWFGWLIYKIYFDADQAYNLGDYILVSNTAFTVIRGIQQEPETGLFRAYSSATWPLSEIQGFGDWLTAAVNENMAGKLPIQTRSWTYFVSPLALPLREGIASEVLASIEPLEGLVPALRRQRAVRRLEG